MLIKYANDVRNKLKYIDLDEHTRWQLVVYGLGIRCEVREVDLWHQNRSVLLWVEASSGGVFIGEMFSFF